MVVWGWICPLQREVELEEIDESPAALQRTIAAGFFIFFCKPLKFMQDLQP